jgi:nucleoside-diphosphate-sugar epimerase
MTTLITGATGFLGSTVLAKLIAAQTPVRIFTRSPDKLGPAVDNENVEVFHGDLVDPESVREAVRGVKRIFHIAAAVSQNWEDPALFDQINVLALKNLLRAADEQKVERVVYTSSFMALGPTDKIEPGDESLEHDPKHFHNLYEKTKYQALQVARDYAEKGGPIVILCPGAIFGPGPLTEGNRIAQLIRNLALEKISALPGGGKSRMSFSFIEDVANGHLLAMDHAQIGQTYILGGQNVTVREFVDRVCREAGLTCPKRGVPIFLASMRARWIENWARLTGVEPSVTPGKIGVMKHSWAYSSQKAIDAFGYRQTSFTDALTRTLIWMERGEMLPKAD